MEFPLTFTNESDLSRFISSIVKYTARRTVTEMLLQLGKIKPYMTKAECGRMSSERKVATAIKRGELKFVVKGRNILIKREDFETWLQKDIWL